MFKCYTCNKLKTTPDISCDTPTKCNIKECATICYASKDGLGLLVGSAQTTITHEDKTTQLVTENVKLHCNCTDTVTNHTTAIHAVTCINCLNSLKKEE